MNRAKGLVVVWVLLLGGCTVPSLEELMAGRGVRVTVNYTPSFKKGCFVIKVQDVEGAGVERESKSISAPTGAGTTAGILQVNLMRKEGWPSKVKVTVTAHEKDCVGAAVNTRTVEVNLEDNGSTSSVTLVTPDEDGDGYVAKAAANDAASQPGGTDCQDSGTNAAARSPGNSEVCDFVDNNCVDGVDEGLPVQTIFRDEDGDGVGGEQLQSCMPATGYVTVGGDCDDRDASRTPGRTELCDEIDNNCNAAVDEGYDKNWYLDSDGDGVPASVVNEACDSPGPKYMHYAAWATFDCDDANAARYPGNAEVCDGIDNNCTGVDGNMVDENFPTKDTECFNQSCRGTFICNVSNPAEVTCSAQAPRRFYPDLDGDLDGDATATAQDVCEGVSPPAGHVENDHGDCDDKDSARSSRLSEACDAIDNNCREGVSDEPVSCGGTLKQVASYHLSSDDQDWRTVAVHSSGYPVWVAGRGGKLAIRRSANAKFESFSFGDPANPSPSDGSMPVHSNNCTDVDWMASWVDSMGRVFLAGEAGSLAVHNGTTSTACAVGGTGGSNLTGLVGFEANGATTLYATDTEGKLYRWVLGSAVSELNDNSVNYYGLHGLREEFLLAVGGLTGSGGGQRVRSYSVTSGGATPTSHVHSTNVVGNAKAVWMGSNTTACAVGDNGAVWRWDGGMNWNKEAVPGGVTVPFTSVVMRNHSKNPQWPSGHCYMVDGSTNGKLRRMTPHGWGTGPVLDTVVPLNDIAMAAEKDFWIVGEDGRVFHYPEP